ncbi:class I SAM-dependent methyltransferase [Noviherbaspirillum pedocola]|uniref:Class I SAM-dependent methyltransferase n=1 Tax=Noviherbaspirillum pedocola TaxID=2801341 RepID=A0A934ST84_9BURK|nr:class I SAM-dependent methyltransferase [Noviherbaspirillum pedocola]MBK4736170.1 class I SAM-dependent methyltransferase [Noviherbaspirillum pedocola]
MLRLDKIIWNEYKTKSYPPRINEPSEAMDDPEQIRSYVAAYEWGGPSSALQLHHLRNLSRMIKPGDTILDLACGPGPLLLELAVLYPECHFIGADLSPNMLQHLEEEARARGLSNVSILCEDIRTLPSLSETKVDLIITTSALHHVPTEDGLRQVFHRMATLLREGGGFYIFDFGLLKSPKTREILVNEVARLAQPITVQDYDVSLQAAYPIPTVVSLAEQELPKPFTTEVCSIADIFYFIRTGVRSEPSARALAYIDKRWKDLSLTLKGEHIMLRTLRKTI